MVQDINENNSESDPTPSAAMKYDALENPPSFRVTDNSNPSIPYYRGYNPRSGDPKYARPDSSRLWEVDLQSCNICPTISVYATLLKKWAFSYSKGDELPNLQTVIPFEPSHYDKSTTGPLDAISSLAVLDLLTYKQPNTSSPTRKVRIFFVTV